jgi:hypothetical protein
MDYRRHNGTTLADEMDYKDGDRRNDDPENLYLFHNKADHSSFHRQAQLSNSKWCNECGRMTRFENGLCSVHNKDRAKELVKGGTQ